jgi:hypothetical protein
MVDVITALSATSLAPANEVKFMPYSAQGTSARVHRDWLVNRYDMLNGVTPYQGWFAG